MPIKCCKCSRQCDGKGGQNVEYIIFKGNYSKPGTGGYQYGSGFSFYYCCNCAKVDGWSDYVSFSCSRCNNKPSVSARRGSTGATGVEVLGNAHREADKIKADALEAAAKIVADARSERDAMLEATRAQAAQILENARKEAAKVVEVAQKQAAGS